MMVGPTKPPRLPIELISAMPAAADRPPSSCGGIAQKTAASDRNPICAMVKPNTRIHGYGCEATATSRPTAVTAAHAATCNRRSPVRSECRPTTTIATNAATNGSAVIALSGKPSASVTSRSSRGSQRNMP